MADSDEVRGAIKSLMKALEVLRAIRPDEALGVSEIARDLGLQKVAVQRILTTLNEAGWVTPTLKTPTRWLAGPALYEFCAKFRRGWDLRPAALPAMRHLRDQTGETVNLGLLRDRYIVWIEQIRSLHGLSVQNAVGEIIPCHAAAAGKAILASLAESQVGAIVGGMTRITNRTITDIDDLLRDLETTRGRGYSISVGEGTEGVVGVGAAIVGPDGDPVAAISVAGPENRMTKAHIEEAGKFVVQAAAAISAEIP